MQPRCFHTATAISLAPDLTEVTMFGGCPKIVPGATYHELSKLAETAVLQFGESMTSTALLIAVRAVDVYVILAHIMCTSMRTGYHANKVLYLHIYASCRSSQ